MTTMAYERPSTATGLHYDRTSDRWMLSRRALHCGDGLEVRVGGHWLPCRLEHDDLKGWVPYADSDTVQILPSMILPARPDPYDGRW